MLIDNLIFNPSYNHTMNLVLINCNISFMNSREMDQIRFVRASASQTRCCLGLVSTRRDETSHRATRAGEAGLELARRRACPTWRALEDGVTPTRRPTSGRRNYDAIIFIFIYKFEKFEFNKIKKIKTVKWPLASKGRFF